jgi:hypothetical protein
VKQTAVEYLVEQLFPKVLSEQQYYHIEKAKEMEKEQIMHAYGQGAADEAGEILDATKDSEEYYDKKYGGEK